MRRIDTWTLSSHPNRCWNESASSAPIISVLTATLLRAKIKSMSDKAKGFAVIGVLIVGAILGVVGGMRWYAYSNHRNKERANDAVSITSSTLSGTITEGPTSPTSQGSEGSETAVAN